MGKFEEKIPEYIAQLQHELDVKQADIRATEVQIEQLTRAPHYCDCEYCGYDEYKDNLPWDAEEKAEEATKNLEKLMAEATQLQLTQNRLIRHAQLHGIKVSELLAAV